MSINITADGKRTMSAGITWLPHNDILQRAVRFVPGYQGDRDVPDNRNYGVHGMEIWWYLRGPKGAAHFGIFTNWIPGPLAPGWGLPPAGMVFPRREFDHYPLGVDLGYHAHVPQWEGQEAYARADCDVIGGTCYGDGTALGADHLAKEFVLAGEPVVWAALEERYAELTVDVK